MILRFFYLLTVLIFTPLALLFFFKPQLCQDIYARFYQLEIEPKWPEWAKAIVKALVEISKSDLGEMLHKFAGILLGLISAFILLKKLI